MDKRKALRKLEELGATKYWELGEVIQILKAVVKEMDDRDTREHVRMHMNAAIRESNDPRTSLRDLTDLKQPEYLSFTQAIKVLREDSKSVYHVSWSKSDRLDPYANASGFVFCDGESCYNYFNFNIDMLDSGWIVLDR